jgi:hypothetical protein
MDPAVAPGGSVDVDSGGSGDIDPAGMPVGGTVGMQAETAITAPRQTVQILRRSFNLYSSFLLIWSTRQLLFFRSYFFQEFRITGKSSQPKRDAQL